MGHIMGAKAQTVTAQLDLKGDKKGGKLGTLIIRAEAVKSSNIVASFQVCGLNLPNLERSCFNMCSKMLPVSYQWLKAT